MWAVAGANLDDDIVKMSLGLYVEDPGHKMVSAEQISRTLEELRQNPVRGRVVVFQENDHLQGYAILVSFWSNELGGEICIIDELFVRKEFRGQGAASMLVESILKDRDLWPIEPVAIDLEVTPNNARARDLYLRLGFRPAKNASLRMLL